MTELVIEKTKLTNAEYLALMGDLDYTQDVATMVGVAYEWLVRLSAKGDLYAARMTAYGPYRPGQDPPRHTWVLRHDPKQGANAWRVLMNALVEETALAIAAEIGQ